MSHLDSTSARWIKSSRSEANGNSVELAAADRHDRRPRLQLGTTSPVLRFTPTEFTAWLDAAKLSEFDDLA